ncbi:ChaN family lipoprotein [Tenuifilum osseticum]|uniref:ChaN family lipoprotein n=1 Tax=Tenuifilum osseticum TaxID=3374723 RepID=UPI0034E50D78
MKQVFFCLIVCLISVNVFGQDKYAYTIFNGKGDKVVYQSVVSAVKNSDLLLFGELHDNPIAHWLELELTVDVFEATKGNIILGAEMFEADNQLILDEYLGGLISQQRFEAEARLWPNYKTDYKPLVEFAKSKGLKFVATNIPRRYAAMVSAGGFDTLQSLSVMAKSFIAPLPVEYDPNLGCYKGMLSMMGMPGKGKSNPEYFPMAQAIKDATMAYNITRNTSSGKVFLHFHGSYHSNNYEGICWYVKRKMPNLKIVTIATVTQDDVNALAKENMGIADFVIVVPERMTRTY